jgi:hypothetical protein
MGFKASEVLSGESLALARAGRFRSVRDVARVASAQVVGARLVERYVEEHVGERVRVSPLGTVPLALPVAGVLYARGEVDALGSFLCDAVAGAMARQYPVAVIVPGLGSFGGDTAFRGIRHRSVVENAGHYGLRWDWDGCSVCGCSSPDLCHGVPRVMGGNLTVGNLSLGCRDCNRRKSSTLTESELDLLAGYVLHVDVSGQSMQEWVK